MFSNCNTILELNRKLAQLRRDESIREGLTITEINNLAGKRKSELLAGLSKKANDNKDKFNPVRRTVPHSNRGSAESSVAIAKVDISVGNDNDSIVLDGGVFLLGKN